jgi:hypothetical protein
MEYEKGTKMTTKVLDVTNAADMLQDYFGVIVPTEFLREAVLSDDDIIDSVENDYITDTMDRSTLMDIIGKKLGISVSVPGMFNTLNSHSYPCYGDSIAYRNEYIEQLGNKLSAIGGELLSD